MSEYRVISEPYQVLNPMGPTPKHRRVRGDAGVKRVITIVSAPDIFVAMHEAITQPEHQKRSITSIEEQFPVDALYFSDQDISDALRRLDLRIHDPESDLFEKLDPEDFNPDEALDPFTFATTFPLVATILADTLLPGLGLTVVADLDNSHVIVEMRDEATGTYRSSFVDIRDLIQDRSATGWNSVISIARAVISRTEDLV